MPNRKKVSYMKEILNLKQKNRLLTIARTTIKEYVETQSILDFKEDDSVLNENLGAFVTLHKKGALRGCIGNIIGQKPLYITIRDMAIEAAFRDPRFSPLSSDEILDVDIEISVLSKLKKIDNSNEIIIGTHGVLVKQGFKSGVYLPQVGIETGWSKDEFMDSLCGQKAGIPKESWRDGSCEIYIFTATVFS